jgi:cytochrome c oxidase accessory protein FixG
MEEFNSRSDQEFRDQLSIITKKGNRKWIYAKKPKGKLYFYRSLLSIFLLVIFFIGPFLKLNDQPLLMFNFLERKFVLFGVVFWPQDSYIFFLIMISMIVFIILFTVVYGRLWCGWACPQTIFLEMLFRKVEYWIEGDSKAQIKLNKQSWNFEKILKRGLKHLIFIVLSIIIIQTLLAYILGIDYLKSLLLVGPSKNMVAFLSIGFITLIFYFVFSWFREQVCIIVCPYGRLQGVFLDSKSIVVSYDYKRGEPRGNEKVNEDRNTSGKGDCINCHSCVTVCPTGIDIRNGTQLECVNCTACIDSCNEVMKRIGKPKGLVRYASEDGISKGLKLKINWRIGAYTTVLIALMSFLIFLLASKNPIETTVLRTPGALYQELPDHKISNLYNIKIINKTRKDIPVEIIPLSVNGDVKLIKGDIIVKSESLYETIFFLNLDQKDVTGKKMEIILGIYSEGKLLEKAKTAFVGPSK